MNKKVNLDSEVLKLLISANKQFLVPIGIIFAGILLLIFFIIPEFNGFSAKQQEISSEELKLRKLQSSLSVLSSSSDSVVQKDLDVTSQALPPDKDFALILNAISSASSLSGVSLGDFEFQIGDINAIPSTGKATPSIKITVNISGSVEAANRFMNELARSVPVSEISGVKSGGSFSSINMVFYYKPFPPKNITSPENIIPISDDQQKLIDGIYIPPTTSDDITSPSVDSSL